MTSEPNRLSILHISDLHARSRDVDELPEEAREKRKLEVGLGVDDPSGEPGD